MDALYIRPRRWIFPPRGFILNTNVDHFQSHPHAIIQADSAGGACCNMTPAQQAWEDYESTLKQFLHKPDIQATRVLLSAIKAHELDGAPVWLMIVAPPGSGKSEVVGGLDGLSHVHLLDEITPNTFLSGKISEPGKVQTKSASLLHRIGKNGILVFTDFSTILARDGDAKVQIFAQLRKIFDGHFHKEVGTADKLDERRWEGRITTVAAVTPEIDRHQSMFQSLGERFVNVRWPRADGVIAAKAAMSQDIASKKELIRAHTHGLLAAAGGVWEPDLNQENQDRIAALAELTVHVRSHVARDGKDRSRITDLPTIESPTRLAQQLAQLAKGAALLLGRKAVGEDDYALVKRAAFDSMPPQRSKLLTALIQGQPLKSAGLPAATQSYASDDLQALGVFDEGYFTPFAIDLLTQAGVSVCPPTKKVKGGGLIDLE